MQEIALDVGLNLTLDALVNDRLAVLLGAGLSMAAPSSLPSGARLCRVCPPRHGVYAGIAVVDLAALRHAPEQDAAALVLEEGRREVYEVPVYVMFRKAREISLRYASFFIGRPS
jgi:hypothetical protein